MDRQEFLGVAGLRTEVLEVWLEQRWLIPQASEGGAIFSEIDLARVRLIHDLQDGIGANEAGIDVILHLMDQLHGLRRALSEVRDEMRRIAS